MTRQDRQRAAAGRRDTAAVRSRRPAGLHQRTAAVSRAARDQPQPRRQKSHHRIPVASDLLHVLRLVPRGRDTAAVRSGCLREQGPDVPGGNARHRRRNFKPGIVPRLILR